MANASNRSKGEQTRERILDAALAAFREHGFDQATMRDIASRAGMSLGAAYYYFPSKDALVQAYYRRINVVRSSRVRAAFEHCETLHERLHAVFSLHLDTVGPDRRLLAALTRFVADPESPQSVFSPQMRSLRNRSIDLFYEALSVDEVPEQLRDVGALALWTLDLGFMLYLAWDDSDGQQRSRQLLDNVLGLIMPMLPLLSLPLVEPLIQELARVLIEADLVPDDDPSDEAPADDDSSDEAPADDDSSDEAPADDDSSHEAPADDDSSDEAPAGKAP